MKKDPTPLLCAALLCICALSSSAQDTTRVSSSQNDKVLFLSSRLQRELSLNKNQVAQLKIILEERFNALSSNSLPEVNRVASQKLDKLLSAEQKLTLTQIREQKKRDKAAYLQMHPSYRFSKEDDLLDF